MGLTQASSIMKAGKMACEKLMWPILVRWRGGERGGTKGKEGEKKEKVSVCLSTCALCVCVCMMYDVCVCMLVSSPRKNQ